MKKLIVFASIILTVFLLSGCSTEDPIESIVVNAPVDMVYTQEELETTGYDFTGENGLSYFTLRQSGAIEETLYEGSLLDNNEATSGVLTYGFITNNTQYTFDVYVRPTDYDVNDDSIVLVNFRFTPQNLTTTIGSYENLDGLEVYVVRANSDEAELLTGDDATAFITNNNHEPLTENGFINQEFFNITFEKEGYIATYSVYVAGGEVPIHSEDASFFDWILVIPFAYLTQLFAGIFGNSFIIGILITTIIVRTLAWPIYAKSNDMSLKMNLAQPEMQKVQNKYATKKDPQSQQQMQAEMMQVYKKYGIGFGGCLLPFLQMPIFIAMFNVVRRITVEGGMYADNVSNTMFLGIDVTAANSTIIAGLLAVIVGATMFALQKIAQTKPAYAKNTGTQNAQAAQSQKTMKYVMYFMVFMMMSIAFQSQALAVYWLFGNLYSIGQTLINRKLSVKKHEKLKEKELLGGLYDAKKN